jgi:hypothetical protein
MWRCDTLKRSVKWIRLMALFPGSLSLYIRSVMQALKKLYIYFVSALNLTGNLIADQPGHPRRVFFPDLTQAPDPFPEKEALGRVGKQKNPPLLAGENHLTPVNSIIS